MTLIKGAPVLLNFVRMESVHGLGAVLEPFQVPLGIDGFIFVVINEAGIQRQVRDGRLRRLVDSFATNACMRNFLSRTCLFAQ